MKEVYDIAVRMLKPRLETRKCVNNKELKSDYYYDYV